MTLDQWLQANPKVYAGYHESGCRWIPDSQVLDYTTSSSRWELFHLSDYIVSANRAGVYWLAPR